MTNFDLTNIYSRLNEIDRELKELRKEIGSIGIGLPKSYSQMIADDKPAQWPNEPYTNYLKRIGEYNEASIYEDDTK